MLMMRTNDESTDPRMHESITVIYYGWKICKVKTTPIQCATHYQMIAKMTNQMKVRNKNES